MRQSILTRIDVIMSRIMPVVVLALLSGGDGAPKNTTVSTYVEKSVVSVH